MDTISVTFNFNFFALSFQNQIYSGYNWSNDQLSFDQWIYYTKTLARKIE